eukprot:NODE_51_length_31136_cov_0.357670.p8 type:complete len:313 gc:universal NODE_51_length_31136_cov_0.357670:20367-19429(-)
MPELNIFRVTIVLVCLISYFYLNMQSDSTSKLRRVPVPVSMETNCVQNVRIITNCEKENTIALSIFVDPGNKTLDILEGLKANNIKASFILTPNLVSDWNLVANIVTHGHNLAMKSISENLETNKKLFMENLGLVPKFILSPILIPNSEFNQSQVDDERNTIFENNFIPFMYTVDFQDYQSTYENLKESYTENLISGSNFISIHNEYSNSFNSTIIDFIAKLATQSGVSVVTLDNCLNFKPYWDDCSKLIASNETIEYYYKYVKSDLLPKALNKSAQPPDYKPTKEGILIQGGENQLRTALLNYFFFLINFV